MLIQLLSTMLLLAGSAIGAGAGQPLSIQSKQNVTSFCAPTSPKGAYYDPTGEYGTTTNKKYYYSELERYYTETGIESNLGWSSSGGQPIPKRYTLSLYTFQVETSQFAVYVNGQETPQDQLSIFTDIQGNTPLWGLRWNVPTEMQGGTAPYVWTFDAPRPLNETMNEDIFDVVGDATTASAGILGNGFNAMIALFYANNQLTGLGIICLILTGVGLVWFAWRLVIALWRRRG